MGHCMTILRLELLPSLQALQYPIADTRPRADPEVFSAQPGS